MIGLLSPQANFQGFAEAGALVHRNFRLTMVLATRELVEPYAGQIFGRFWAVGHPLFLIVLYTVVFSVVFNARIGGTHELPLDYTVYILSGLVPWLTFQQAMAKGCYALVANANIVKQIIFPLEVMPLATTFASVTILGIGLAFIAIYTLISTGSLAATWLLLPVLLLLHVVAMTGVAFALSAVSVFVKDVKDFVQLFAVANIFLMPVIYIPEWTPAAFRPVILMNPFSHLIWCYQDLVYFGRIEHPVAWVVVFVLSLLSFAFGYRVLRKLKPYFGNVL